MSESNFDKPTFCECCGKRTPIGDAAARITTERRERVWCLKCWDNKPRAVEQYRSEESYLAQQMHRKEAVARIQGIFANLRRRGRMSVDQFLIVDADISLLARALSIDPLDALDRKPR